MKKLIPVLALALMVAACSDSARVQELEAELAELTETHTINGGLWASHGHGCRNEVSKTTLEVDADVYVKNGAGDVIGLTRLGEPTVTDDTCIFYFTIPGIPDGEPMYRFVIADATWDLSRKELDDKAWTVRLSVLKP